MLLYDHPLSPYAQKVRILLREKGIAFETRLPDGLGSGNDSGYGRHNPRLEVPALVVADGVTLYDSTIILEYLEETYPTPPLHAADPLLRARAREIEEVCDTHYEAINWGLGEIRFFGRGGAVRDTLLAAAARDTAMLMAWLETRLSSGTWLSGASFGWADLAAAPYVRMSALFDLPPAAGTRLADWLARLEARPSVASTFAEAMQSVAGMGHYASLLDSGGFRRQFRDHRLEWMIRAGGIDVVTDGLARDNIRFTDLGLFSA